MPEQIALEGFDDAPQKTDRLFFALFPDAQAAQQIGLLARQELAAQGLRGPALSDERFHLTLQHLGDHAGLPPSLVHDAQQAASRVSARSFDLRFDHAMSFAGRHGHAGRKYPFVLLGSDGVADVTAFQQTLAQALRQTPAGRWVDAGFTPHVTLAYDTRIVADHAVPAIGWTAREFVLVHSLIGKTKHIVLGRWPLVA